jgi:hypothetical protein
MVPLDSPDWSRLTHAYGAASDIPALLHQIAADPRPNTRPGGEPWFSLWSALCHQGDVYGASYAAQPHLVQIALAAAGPIDSSFFHLPACIEVSRARGRGPEIAPELRHAYFAALHDLHLCALRQAEQPWDFGMAICIAAALAAAKGQIDLAAALSVMGEDTVRWVIERGW